MSSLYSNIDVSALRALGFDGTNDDVIKKYLSSLGYDGSIPDALKKYYYFLGYNDGVEDVLGKVPLPPLGGPVNTVAPSASPGGTPEVGVLLTRNNGSWTAQGGGTLSYSVEWIVDNTVVSTSTTYTPLFEDITKTLRLAISATETGGTKPGITKATATIGVITSTNLELSGGVDEADNPDYLIDGGEFTQEIPLEFDGGTIT